MGIFSHKFISKEGEEAIKKFSYKGGSDSILYSYLWSPLCNWIIEKYMPKKIAPNTITSIGFLIHVLVHLIVMIYSPNLKEDIPSWLCFLMAGSLLTYQILDNCDGKQARATKSSSPLGMLFDHGCDATATWMVTLNTLAIFQSRNISIHLYSIALVGLIPFYFAMWSQYYVGVFRLGYINAVDEGLVLAELLYVITGIFGQSIWTKQLPYFNITSGEVTLYFSMGLALFQMIQFTLDLVNGSPSSQIKDAFRNLYCVGVLMITFITLDYFIPKQVLSDNFLVVIYSLCFMWSKIITHLQVSHLTNATLKTFTKESIFICGTFILIASLNQINQPFIINLTGLAAINLVIALSFYIFYVFKVFTQIADILGIYIFKLGKRESNFNLRNEGGISIPIEDYSEDQ